MTSESTLPMRGSGAPLFVTPILPENEVGPQRGTFTKRENDSKGSTNYGLTKERVTQVQSSGTRGSQGPVRVKNPPGNGGGGDSSGGTSGDQRFLGEGRGSPRRNNNQAGGGGDDDPDPSDDRMEMILLPQTPLPQGKENIKVPNMSMYSRDLLDQKIKRVNLDKQEEMAEMDRILP